MADFHWLGGEREIGAYHVYSEVIDLLDEHTKQFMEGGERAREAAEAADRTEHVVASLGPFGAYHVLKNQIDDTIPRLVAAMAVQLATRGAFGLLPPLGPLGSVSIERLEEIKHRLESGGHDEFFPEESYEEMGERLAPREERWKKMKKLPYRRRCKRCGNEHRQEEYCSDECERAQQEDSRRNLPF